MTQRKRLLWLGCVGVALVALACAGDRGLAGGGDPKKDVDAIAAAVQKGDDATAKKMAEKFVKTDDDALFDAMKTMKPPADKAKGFPAGKLGDGIEKAVQEIAKNGIKDVKGNEKDLMDLTNRINAIAHVAQATKQKKMPALWAKLAGTMNEVSMDLAKAVKMGDAAAVQKAAAKLDANCNQCHEKFR